MWSVRFERGVEAVKDWSGLFRNRFVVRRAVDSCRWVIRGRRLVSLGKRKEGLAVGRLGKRRVIAVAASLDQWFEELLLSWIVDRDLDYFLFGKNAGMKLEIPAVDQSVHAAQCGSETCSHFVVEHYLCSKASKQVSCPFLASAGCPLD